MEAARDGNLAAIRQTYPEGCDIEYLNRKDEDGRTALHWACANKPKAGQSHAECVAYLLERRANATTVDDGGWCPLLSAASSGNADIVKTLLDANAKVDFEEASSQCTALHLACSKGHT
ncbi:hypothetical protein GUITHDRAFT_153886, partial [Guillardia theta CCMP2712]